MIQLILPFIQVFTYDIPSILIQLLTGSFNSTAV